MINLINNSKNNIYLNINNTIDNNTGYTIRVYDIYDGTYKDIKVIDKSVFTGSTIEYHDYVNLEIELVSTLIQENLNSGKTYLVSNQYPIEIINNNYILHKDTFKIV
jgi:hypothetical protein